MGRKIRDLSGENQISDAPSVREALLFTTMSIIGLPVEVQVKDGSIYSGILHTACFEKDYGIVLKKAKMTKKGKKDANLVNGDVVDTLVVHSSDLVQVIAKGHLLSADGIVGTVSNEDIEAVNGSIQPLEYSESEMKKLKSGKDAPHNLVAEANHINGTRSADQNEKKLGYGLTNNNIRADLPSNIEKGLGEEVAEGVLGVAVETANGKADGMYSSKAGEAQIGPVSSVDDGQVGKDESQKRKGSDQQSIAHKDNTIHEFHYSSSGSNATIPQLTSVNGVQVDISLRISSHGSACGSPVASLVKPDSQDQEQPTSVGSSSLLSCASNLSNSVATTVNMSSQSYTAPPATQTATIAPKDPVSNPNGKEFKLNPGAKTFLPMFSMLKSVAPPAATAVGSMAYIPNNTPVVPVAVASPEIGISPFVPRPSLPMKYVQYNNMVAVNGDSTLPQFSQHVVGHVGSRPQPIRYASQYSPVQAAPTYVHTNSQPVAVSRLGQLVYMHPVSHDVLQGSTIPSQVCARPPLTTQIHLPKHQGSAAPQALQVCVTQSPFVTTQQPFAMASHIPLPQPAFPTIGPIQVPGPNAHFGANFF